jgi:hypothetical protein
MVGVAKQGRRGGGQQRGRDGQFDSSIDHLAFLSLGAAGSKSLRTRGLAAPDVGRPGGFYRNVADATLKATVSRL